MHVAIAIVSYRSQRDIEACLLALGQSRYADFEVIICENGGVSAYEQLAAALPTLPGGQPVRAILAERNLGYAGGVNRCIQETPGADAWWVLNPDTEPQPGALAALAQRLSAGDCDAVGCTVQLGDDRIQSYGGRWRHHIARAVSLGFGAAADAPVDGARIEALQNYINGAAILASRRFLETAGPMREDYFLYCEEVEWCLRATAAGLRLGFAPDAVVVHHHGTSTGNATSQRERSALSVYLDERNKILVTRDRFPNWLPLASVASLCLLMLRFGRAGAWAQLRQAFGGWSAGLRNERGPPKHLVPGAT